MSRYETHSLDPLTVSFKKQLQSTVLQNELKPEIQSRSLNPSEIDETSNITIKEQ